MKNLVTVLLLIIFTFSCNDNEEFNSDIVCGVENPLENLAWLKEMTSKREQNYYQHDYIRQTSFKLQDIFIGVNCSPVAKYIPAVYNCSGKLIGTIGDEKFPSELLSKGTVIWKSKNNKCDL